MPIEKQSLNNFLPDGFETLNQEGYKENFNEDKIKTGYEKDVPDIVSGPNLNNLIDVVGKNTNTLNSYVEYLNGMPINNVPTVNEFNQLDYTNLDDKLTKKQITNCILEIPQRIKYTLENGTLTIKAGSVVIVPYGTEDLTAQYPKGATFLHENFKVYDTQFADGKFFVWAEVQSDISSDTKETTIYDRFVGLCINRNEYTRNNYVSSGTGDATGNWFVHYSTDKNIVMTTGGSGEIIQTQYGTTSLPFLIATGDGVNSYGSIKQVFNGLGYIGSTVWVDKGVKGLIPNGRNEDGTLKNIEYEFKNIAIIDISNVSMTYQQAEMWYSPDANNVYLSNVYYEQENTPIINTSHALWFNPTENIVKTTNNNGETWLQTGRMFLGLLSTDKTVKNLITSVTFSKTFKAVNYYDKPMVSGWGMPSSKYINLTVGATQSDYIAPANGWVSFSIVCNAGNSYCDLITYTNEGTLYNFVTSKSSSNSAGQYIGVITPVRKGQKFRIQYGNKQTNHIFNFIYAEGEI